MSLRVWLRIGAVVVLTLCTSTTGNAQPQELCEDVADAEFRGCLGALAEYGSWMIVPGREVPPGELQQAIDQIYKSVQEEWTGPLRRRVHVRPLYVYLPLLLALYVAAILVTSRLVRPHFPSNGPPLWRVEKMAIIGGLLFSLGIIFGERAIAYARMNEDYVLVQKTVQRFVHLRSPRQLANATTNPCEVYFSDDDSLVGICKQDWAAQARSGLSRLIGTRLTSKPLLKQTVHIGQACGSVGVLPAWWSQTGDQSERLMKLGCEVYRSGDSSVRFEHFMGLGGLSSWLRGGGESTDLRLEDIFAVQNVGGGGAVYRQKITALVGSEAYADYRQHFLAESWKLGGGAAVVLVFVAFLLYYARRAELHSGSRSWARLRIYCANGVVLLAMALGLLAISRLILS
jgi:hypothetical protein